MAKRSIVQNQYPLTSRELLNCVCETKLYDLHTFADDYVFDF